MGQKFKHSIESIKDDPRPRSTTTFCYFYRCYRGENRFVTIMMVTAEMTANRVLTRVADSAPLLTRYNRNPENF